MQPDSAFNQDLTAITPGVHCRLNAVRRTTAPAIAAAIRRPDRPSLLLPLPDCRLRRPGLRLTCRRAHESVITALQTADLIPLVSGLCHLGDAQCRGEAVHSKSPTDLLAERLAMRSEGGLFRCKNVPTR